MQTTSAITFAPGTAGAPFSPSFDHFTFGPVAEVGLPRRLGLEFEALHRHYAEGSPVFVEVNRGFIIADFADTHTSYWDFPLMLKWRLAATN
jgi:hypothetical protein